MIDLHPIGTIHSPFTSIENMPIQPAGAAEVVGSVVVYPPYDQGLADLDGFSHVYLIYHFNAAVRTAMTVTPFMDSQPRGVFATRSPLRPNHIGLSIVRLLQVEGNRLQIAGVDILDGTPLLDIKPYIAPFDAVGESRHGWFRGDVTSVRQKRSDDRFR